MQLIKHYFYILKNMKNTLIDIYQKVKNALKGVKGSFNLCAKLNTSFSSLKETITTQVLVHIV